MITSMKGDDISEQPHREPLHQTGLGKEETRQK